jgi:hypothetical protein
LQKLPNSDMKRLPITSALSTATGDPRCGPTLRWMCSSPCYMPTSAAPPFRPSNSCARCCCCCCCKAFYTIRSKRLLMEQVDFNLLFSWFVGLSRSFSWPPPLDQLAQGQIRHGSPKPGVLELQFLQPLHLVGLHATVFGASAKIRFLRHRDRFQRLRDRLALGVKTSN